jgi:phage regulator Rha-like protein
MVPNKYNRYTWEEIQASTSSFSVAVMIGKRHSKVKY